jgi:D-glycero-D-manno-heptose 1,7-bisphosphate phosphatase
MILLKRQGYCNLQSSIKGAKIDPAMNKAIFLDRDGVINKTIFKMGKPRAPYSMEEFAFIDGVKEATERLKGHGYLLIVVTNQPDVARGWVSREQVDLVNEHVMKSLPLDEIIACFHTDKDKCLCRKPEPGMILEAQKKWDIDLSKSYLVGDRASDIEAAHRAGCHGILVGEGEEYSDLKSATDWILREGNEDSVLL